MSEDETIHTSSTGGRKAGNMERYDLLPAEPLRKLARHFGVGALKYDDDNWRKGYDWRLSFAAMMRHAWQFWAGEDIDAETGTPHIIAVAWHAIVLDEFAAIHPEFDTRLKTLAQRGVMEDQAIESNDLVAEGGTTVVSLDGRVFTISDEARQKLSRIARLANSIVETNDQPNDPQANLANVILDIITEQDES